MALYYDMFTRWLTPDVKTYGSATSACDEGVKVDQALEFFHLMQHSWETTDIVSYKDAHRRLCEMSWLHQSAFVCLPFFLLPPSSLRLPPSCCDPVLPPISPPFPPSLLPPSSLLSEAATRAQADGHSTPQRSQQRRVQKQQSVSVFGCWALGRLCPQWFCLLADVCPVVSFPPLDCWCDTLPPSGVPESFSP